MLTSKGVREILDQDVSEIVVISEIKRLVQIIEVTPSPTVQR